MIFNVFNKHLRRIIFYMKISSWRKWFWCDCALTFCGLFLVSCKVLLQPILVYFRELCFEKFKEFCESKLRLESSFHRLPEIVCVELCGSSVWQHSAVRWIKFGLVWVWNVLSPVEFLEQFTNLVIETSKESWSKALINIKNFFLIKKSQ